LWTQQGVLTVFEENMPSIKAMNRPEVPRNRTFEQIVCGSKSSADTVLTKSRSQIAWFWRMRRITDFSFQHCVF
jgi:hypothetical protein